VIAERMIITRGTVTSVLGTLERRGLVRRSMDRHDGRRRPVAITASGVQKVNELLPVLHEVEKRWMAALKSHEQQQLLALVAIVQAHGPDREPPGPDSWPEV